MVNNRCLYCGCQYESKESNAVNYSDYCSDLCQEKGEAQFEEPNKIKSFTSSKPINPDEDETDDSAKRNDEMNSLEKFS